MIIKFEEGKRYRFNKELFKSISGGSVTGWEDNIHLHEVTIMGNSDGYAGDYLISPQWCEEIVIEPLKTRDDIKDMYKQVLYLEELEEILEEMLDAMDKDMTIGQMQSNFVKYIKSEIERVIDELGLEE